MWRPARSCHPVWRSLKQASLFALAGAIFADWAQRNEQSHHCTVARRDETVIGVAWLAVLPRVPSSRAPVRASGDVQCVYVVPHERDSGVGARMLDSVLDRAFAPGLERVTVLSTPGAVTAYRLRRAGFVVSERLVQATCATTVKS